MINQTLAQCLVLFMLFITSSRFIFIQNAKTDSLSIVPLIALVVSVLNLFLFNINDLDILLTFLSLFIFICNFRSLLRLLSGLIFDVYSIKFIVISVINIILIITLFFQVISCRPFVPSQEKFKVKETKTLFSGNCHDGFSEIKKPFVLSDATLYKIMPTEKPSSVAVIFLPPKTTTTRTYIGFMYKLAREGVTVYSADFSTHKFASSNEISDNRFSRRYNFIKKRNTEKSEYERMISKNREYFVDELESTMKMADLDGFSSIFLVSEEDFSKSMKIVAEKNKKISGYFDLSNVENYTSAGFGPLENSDPFFGKYKGISPDRSGYLSIHLANEVLDFISYTFTK